MFYCGVLQPAGCGGGSSSMSVFSEGFVMWVTAFAGVFTWLMYSFPGLDLMPRDFLGLGLVLAVSGGLGVWIVDLLK